MASGRDESGDAQDGPMRRAQSARGTARLAAVQALYQMDLAATDASDVIGEFTRHRFGHEVDGAFYDRADESFFKDLVLGVVRAQRDVDLIIAANLASGWRLSRIDSILRAILRAAVYEMRERSDVPAKVIINEYLDVAHAFFGGDEPGVVNGILDAVAREIRSGEVKDRAHG